MTHTYTTTVTVSGKPYAAKARRCENEQEARNKITAVFATNFPNCDIFVGKLVTEETEIDALFSKLPKAFKDIFK
jgi:hypothetical protein